MIYHMLRLHDDDAEYYSKHDDDAEYYSKNKRISNCFYFFNDDDNDDNDVHDRNDDNAHYDEYDDDICMVCLSGIFDETDKIIYCDGSCGTATHLSCYGLEKDLDKKVKNPDTGKMIKLKTALGYEKDSKAYKAAQFALKQK